VYLSVRKNKTKRSKIDDEEEILSFIKNGGNPVLTDKDGGTALMSAAAMKNESLTRYLISLMVDVNARDSDGTTA